MSVSSKSSSLGIDDQIIPLTNNFINSVFFIPILPQFNSIRSVMITPPRIKEFVAITTIIDNNSFFHSLLKASYPKYNVSTEEERIKMASDFRKQCADILIEPNTVNYPNEQDVLDLYNGIDPRLNSEKSLPLNCYYFTLYKGILPKIFNNVDGDIKGYDYLMSTLNSNIELPSIFYFFITEICYFNLNIFKHQGYELELTSSYISTPPRALILENSQQGLFTQWERVTICLLEIDIENDDEQKIYQPIGYRTYDEEKLVCLNFQSKTETYK